MLLKDKVAIVTGGTRGIGYEIARVFLQNGASVIIWGSREETVDKALKSLKEENADWNVSGRYPDLTNAKQVQDTINEIYQEYKRLDILVNNAGVSEDTSTFEVDPDDFRWVMDLNVNAVFYASQAAAKIMKEQGGGSIISISSMVAKNGQNSGVAYPASKFALNGLTISLARELAPHNIRVNAVAPGVTATDMVSALPEEVVAALDSNIPLQRIGQPEEVANCFLFLASDYASYVTGEILSVDGAMSV